MASYDSLLSLCLSTRPAVAPTTFWRSWSFAPEIVIPLAALLAFCVSGILTRRSPRSPARIISFIVGWLALAVAVVSPLCRVSASLAWAHMIQHVILVAVAPPLLVLGTQRGGATVSGSAARGSERLPLIGILYMAVIWAAHAPTVYEAALENPFAHLALLAALIGVSVLFWRAVLRPAGDGAPAFGAHAGGVVLCFTAMVQTSLLGALLTLSHGIWYPIFVGRTVAWGLTPLEDQQFAGAIMWVPMGAIYICAGLALIARWLQVQSGGARFTAKMT